MPVPGGDTEVSQGVADILSTSENMLETPGGSEIVLSPRSLRLPVNSIGLIERPRLLQPLLHSM